MSRQDIEGKVQEIRELKRMQEELSAELEALTCEIKAQQFTKTTTARRFCIA